MSKREGGGSGLLKKESEIGGRASLGGKEGDAIYLNC